MVEKNTPLDITSRYNYGHHMALIEDNVTKTGLLYMTGYISKLKQQAIDKSHEINYLLGTLTNMGL